MTWAVRWEVGVAAKSVVFAQELCDVLATEPSVTLANRESVAIDDINATVSNAVKSEA